MASFNTCLLRCIPDHVCYIFKRLFNSVKYTCLFFYEHKLLHSLFINPPRLVHNPSHGFNRNSCPLSSYILGKLSLVRTPILEKSYGSMHIRSNLSSCSHYFVNYLAVRFKSLLCRIKTMLHSYLLQYGYKPSWIVVCRANFPAGIALEACPNVLVHHLVKKLRLILRMHNLLYNNPWF